MTKSTPIPSVVVTANTYRLHSNLLMQVWTNASLNSEGGNNNVDLCHKYILYIPYKTKKTSRASSEIAL